MLSTIQIRKNLIKRVDVDHETQASIAKSYNRTAGTICSQIKRARKKLAEWKEKLESPAEANLDKYVFERLNRGDSPWLIIAEIGRTDEVMESVRMQNGIKTLRQRTNKR